MKLIASLLLATAFTLHGEVKVTVGDISDKRTTGQFFAGLDMDLKISGPETVDCKGLRVVVKEVKDDTGKAVKVRENTFSEGGFEDPKKNFSGFGSGDKKNELRAKVELENPPRAAKTLMLDGTVELLIPGKDPAAVVSVNVAKEAGKQLVNDALKAAGVTITFKAAKGAEASYTITDPGKKVASVEFCSADGKPLETSGHMASGFNGKKDVTVNFRDEAGAGMTAKIYLATPKSVVSVPLKLAGVPLP